jgi:large subunit ribosomal protein L4
MPQKMRRAALLSCLSLRAKEGAILGLENYPDDVKTKSFMSLLKKLPVQIGRRIVVVLPSKHRGIELSARNIPRVKTILAQYLNPEDILGSMHVIFLVDAIAAAEKIFMGNLDKPLRKAKKEKVATEETAEKKAKKPAKPRAKKAS